MNFNPIESIFDLRILLPATAAVIAIIFFVIDKIQQHSRDKTPSVKK